MSVNTQAQTSIPTKSTLIPSGKPLIWLLLFSVLSIAGIISAAMILTQGHSALASTDYVPWNIFISAYVFFVVICTGLCFIAAIGHVLGVERYEIISKRAVTLSFIMLSVGMIGLTLDLGRPLMMINMFLSPNFKSPMFWMGIFYAAYAFLLLMEIFAVNKGDHKATKMWSKLTLISAVFANGTLGALFGMIYGKDMWYGEYMPVYFILTAAVSGLAALSMFVILSYNTTGKTMPSKLESLVSELGKLLVVALGVLLFFVFWKAIAGLYAGKAETSMLLFGDYAIRYWLFEIIIGILIPMFILANKSMRTKGGILISSIMVLVGLVVARLNFVIVGQLVRPYEQEIASYTANSLEIMYFAGLFGFAGIMYMIASAYMKFDKFEEQA